MVRCTAALSLLLVAHSLGAQDARPSVTVGTATATRGTAAMGTINVPAALDSGLRIPVAVVHGVRRGPVVAFVAGDIHAPTDGVVTFIRGVQSMWPKATLVNIARVVPAPPAWLAP